MKVTKWDLVVASTQHHCAGLLKYYLRRPCTPSFVKSRTLHPLQTRFLIFQEIFFVLVCIHPGTPRVPPRVLASGPKPCGGNEIGLIQHQPFTSLVSLFSETKCFFCFAYEKEILLGMPMFLACTLCYISKTKKNLAKKKKGCCLIFINTPKQTNLQNFE